MARISKKKAKKAYHHGDLAESLLEAVDHIARRFGIEAVTLRACAKHLGVAPSAGFRHYADKRALFTAFATRAQQQMAEKMKMAAESEQNPQFIEVGLAYINFALEETAAFQVMWRQELIYAQDPQYIESSKLLANLIQESYTASAENDHPNHDVLPWSVVHGLATLYTDGPLLSGANNSSKLAQARETLANLILSNSPK